MTKLAIHGGTPVRAEPLPIFRLKLGDDELADLSSIAKSGQLSRGEGPANTEAAFCRRLNVAHSVVVSSGTAALHLAINALDLPAGSEVVLPSLTFVATAWALEYCGLIPRFCEVSPDTYNVTATTMEACLSERTRALLPVHYGGQAAPMAEIKALAEAHDLRLVEDAAHAMGARYPGSTSAQGDAVGSGALSDLTTFSFFATKNITGGEGGLVTTNDQRLADEVRRARSFGFRPLEPPRAIPGWYDVEALGYNYHLSNLNIALIEAQLPKLDVLNDRRQRHAAALTELLRDVPGIAHLPRAEGPQHVFHLYTIQLDVEALRASRLEVAEALLAEGIHVGFYYPPVHLFQYFQKKYGTKRGDLPVTEGVTDSLLTLPMYPLLEKTDLEDIAAALRKVLAHYRR